MPTLQQAAQAQHAVTSQFDQLTGANEKKAPDPEEQKAKQRMREERDKRNAQGRFLPFLLSVVNPILKQGLVHFSRKLKVAIVLKGINTGSDVQ